MGKDFETHLDATLDTTPDTIWDAIATGPGISSWFVGRTEIDGDTIRTAFGDDWIPTGTIKTSDQPHHFAYASPPAPDGRYIAYEYLVEAQDRSATVLRTVTSGFLPGDDWADEYEAMQYGTQLFFATLVELLRHFPGRTATPVTAFGPPVTDWPATWKALHARLGLGPEPAAGDPVPGGGQVYFVNPHTLGLRTPRGLYRYLRGFHGSLVAGHALLEPDDTDWTAFLRDLH
jgi:hypothetical protein